MLENLQVPPSTTESTPVLKCYAPPNQRNVSANRRKSSGKLTPYFLPIFLFTCTLLTFFFNVKEI
ncbi:hypothetical protein JHK82_055291 [Glycine max]|uniref:Uncharacterized protein n=2 Tax=Glycine subgen. Soja TaxID=1462606 RepID=A0A0R0EI45_SOYBN|nr:hypothetical protein JHK86_055129 [Glycine max]KAG4917823.1 hypothetical protein JHK85_056104 [Glycine max]KAG5073923.1 hypothetical protein JHK84_055154 [Glycine max]KAG5076596.1 hypothetical protein JHK82_055291 [Glycine max]KAH1034499.1 hypothetical protein GYH30_054778 [Glycine max]